MYMNRGNIIVYRIPYLQPHSAFYKQYLIRGLIMISFVSFEWYALLLVVFLLSLITTYLYAKLDDGSLRCRC